MIPDWIGNTIVAAFFLAGSYAFCYGTLADRLGRWCLKVTGKGDYGSSDGVNDSAHAMPGTDSKADAKQAHMRSGAGRQRDDNESMV